MKSVRLATAIGILSIVASMACGTDAEQPTQIVLNTATAILVPTAIPATLEPTARVKPSIILEGLDVVTVSVGGAGFGVEVADELHERTNGLSGRPGLPEDGGMLFVFESGVASSFWMKGMEFPLDFIWISADCRVVDFHQRVQPSAPGALDSELESYASNAEAAFNLEVNAGLVERLGLQVDMQVVFSDSRDGLSYGCEENQQS
ncbi:MAG: DUF192 domain-containing protein [Chloroflexi bacterium]|nr:DUF192 domain-containing protein [Chloroflexota bacterium]